MDNQEKFEKLFRDKPPLHHWHGVHTTGGFEDESLRLVYETAKKSVMDGELNILEIGAGMTTLAMLCASPTRHVAICPEPQTLIEITRYATENGIGMDNLQFVKGRSEIELPRLVLDKPPQFTFALIDGGHNFTQCWNDYVYCRYALKRGGIILIDDIQLYSCRQLALFIKASPDWEDIGGHGAKCKLFRKLSDEPFDGDFSSSPFVMMNTL